MACISVDDENVTITVSNSKRRAPEDLQRIFASSSIGNLYLRKILEHFSEMSASTKLILSHSPATNRIFLNSDTFMQNEVTSSGGQLLVESYLEVLRLQLALAVPFYPILKLMAHLIQHLGLVPLVAEIDSKGLKWPGHRCAMAIDDLEDYVTERVGGAVLDPYAWLVDDHRKHFERGFFGRLRWALFKR